jgi:MFS family permease
MFDGAEMGLFSMVGRDAMKDLLAASTGSPPSETDVSQAFGVILAFFLVGAAAGGVVFGWLGDRIGRVRAMSLSVLVYALLTGLCGLAQTPLQLGVLRFLASLGMGGEWALGVALVMEVWPNRSRALMAGLIGAAANAGYLVVGFASMVLTSLLLSFHDGLIDIGASPATADMLVANRGWRLMMMLGTLPALLTFFIRMFVPESRKWEEEQARGHTSGWRTIDLVGVLIGCLGPALIIRVWTWDFETSTTATTVLVRSLGTVIGLIVATVGFTYPVWRYIDRSLEHEGQATSVQLSRSHILGRMFLGACLSGVALLGTWGTTQWAVSWVGGLKEAAQTAAIDSAVPAEQPSMLQRYAREWTQIGTAVGAIIGTLLAAGLGEALGRRTTYCLMCVLSMASVIWLYQFHNTFGISLLTAATVAGICTASFYGWLPLYLPELFPTRVRATGQGFAFNFGRILAAIGTLQMSGLLEHFKDLTSYAGVRGGTAVACSWLTGIYLVGVVLIWFAPETKGKPLPE